VSIVSCGGNVSAAATLALTKPTDLLPGDILIAYCCSYRSTSAAPTTATIANTGSGGSSWNSVVNQTTATYYKSAYCWKVITAASDGSVTAYTWTATNATRMAGCVVVLRGRRNQAPTPISNTAYITSDTIIRAATLTGIARDDLVWVGYNYRSTVQATAIPSGWTSGTVQTAGAAIGCAMAYKEGQAAGATGSVDGSMANAVATKHAFMFAVQEADSVLRQSGPSRMW
jgi:hypothetical protein